jgi:hypothetical protein
MPEPAVLTISQLAARLRVGDQPTRAHSTEVPASKLGGQRQLRRVEAHAWSEEGTTEAAGGRRMMSPIRTWAHAPARAHTPIPPTEADLQHKLLPWTEEHAR